MMILTQLEKFR